jgi:pimeloyl-ACP methyl ester carboxylesterase
MRYIVVHGVEVFYRDEGAGPAIILGHSSTGSSGQWRRLMARLSDRFRLIAPDHLGYGKTGPYTGEIPLMEHERAIITALIDFVGEPVHLVGHSYGGAILAGVAGQTPERVRTLTVAEPVCFNLLAPAGMTAEHKEIQALAERIITCVEAGNPLEAARSFIDYWIGPGAFDVMDPRVRDATIRAARKLRAEWLIAFEDSGATRAALAALTMPILLIVGAETTPAARGVVEILHGLWPHAHYAEIESAGHMAPVTQADAVNAIIEAFITQASKGS